MSKFFDFWLFFAFFVQFYAFFSQFLAFFMCILCIFSAIFLKSSKKVYYFGWFFDKKLMFWSNKLDATFHKKIFYLYRKVLFSMWNAIFVQFFRYFWRFLTVFIVWIYIFSHEYTQIFDKNRPKFTLKKVFASTSRLPSNCYFLLVNTAFSFF